MIVLFHFFLVLRYVYIENKIDLEFEISMDNPRIFLMKCRDFYLERHSLPYSCVLSKPASSLLRSRSRSICF